MVKGIRAAAFVVVLGMGMVGMAAPGMGTAKGMKIDVGGTRVDIEPGASVSLQAPGTDVRTALSSTAGEPSIEVRDGRIRLTGDRQTRTVTCGDEGAEVLVSGTSNDYLIRGECKYIAVSGVSNRVRVETVGRMDVAGSGNLLLWQHQELAGTGGSGRGRAR